MGMFDGYLQQRAHQQRGGPFGGVSGAAQRPSFGFGAPGQPGMAQPPWPNTGGLGGLGGTPPNVTYPGMAQPGGSPMPPWMYGSPGAGVLPGQTTGGPMTPQVFPGMGAGGQTMGGPMQPQVFPPMGGFPGMQPQVFPQQPMAGGMGGPGMGMSPPFMPYGPMY